MIAIVGSRWFLSGSDPKRIIRMILKKYPTTQRYLSGGCRGVDMWAAESVQEYTGQPIISIKADWDRFGKAAGPRRNSELVSRASAVYGVWNGFVPSKGRSGTLDTVEKAERAGKLRSVFILLGPEITIFSGSNIHKRCKMVAITKDEK